MAGPWEKYGSTPVADNGPWAKYGGDPTDKPGLVSSAGAGAGEEFGRVVLGGQKLVGRGLQKVDELLNGKSVTGLVTGAHSGMVGRAGDWLVNDAATGQSNLASENAPYKEAHPIANGSGKFGADMVITAPVGGLLASAARALAPASVAASPLAANIIRAVETSGAQGGNLLARSAGGAITGAASAGVIDPDHIVSGAVVGGAAPAALQLIGKAGSAIGNALRGSAEANPQKLAAARLAQRSGYVVPPSDIQPQGFGTEVMGGLSGKIKTAQEASARNAKVTTDLAKSELGVPADEALTADALDAIRKKAGEAYGRVANIGKVNVPNKLDVPPGIKVSTAPDMMTMGARNTVDVRDLVSAWKQANHDATGYYRAYGRDANPETLAKAKEAASHAKSLDSYIQKIANQTESTSLDASIADLANNTITPGTFVANLLRKANVDGGSAPMSQALKDARVLIAKTHSVEDAMNPATGEVSAQALAKQLKKGKALSGNLLSAAQFAQAFPKAAQDLKEAPKAVSPLDWFAALARHNPMDLASLGARPLVRNALLSGPAQRYAAREMGPSFVDGLANDQNALMMYRALPVLAASR